MPEILTESFCERCGTRYTFESAAPRKTRRLGQFKTLSKGMKNWVMSDDTSLDEAMAAARNDDEREITGQQLDAFHATFNFCMTCRQYTCANCWNTAEGRCLTCSPHLGHDVLPAAFPAEAAFEPVRIDIDAWPEVDLTAPDVAASNGNGKGAHEAADPWAAAGATDVEEIPDFDAAARLAFLSGETSLPALEPEPEVVLEAEPEPLVAAEVEAEPEPLVAAEVEAEPIAAALEPEPIAAEQAAPIAAADELPPALDGRVVTAATRTSELLRRFRPGQNIDAEIAAFEAEHDHAAPNVAAAPASATEAAPLVGEPAPLADATPASTPVEDASWPAPSWLQAALETSPAEAPAQTAEPAPVAAQAAPVAAEQVAQDEVVVAQAEPIEAEAELVATAPEPVAAEAEPAPAAAAPAPVEAAPAPVAAEPVAPFAPAPAPAQPVPAEPVPLQPVRDDRIQQPTWQIFAPDTVSAPVTPVPAAVPVPPPAPAPLASGAPQWPVRPDQIESPAMALLANRAAGTPSDALWAASAQEVIARPATTPAGVTTGVQPCSSCGLSLSATARFCRRCGTRQG